ncbi:MAG: hypothetical protein QXX95_00550 [Nitrososphaerales archaeon]
MLNHKQFRIKNLCKSSNFPSLYKLNPWERQLKIYLPMADEAELKESKRIV